MHNYTNEIPMPNEKAIQKFLWQDYFHDSFITSISPDKKRNSLVITLQCDRDCENEWQKKNKHRQVANGAAEFSVDLASEKFTYYLTFENVEHFAAESFGGVPCVYINGRFKDTAMLRRRSAETSTALYHFRISLADGYIDIIFEKFKLRKAAGRLNYAFEPLEETKNDLSTDEIKSLHRTIEAARNDDDDIAVCTALESLYRHGDEATLKYARQCSISSIDGFEYSRVYSACLLGKLGDLSDIDTLQKLWRDFCKFSYTLLMRKNVLDAIELLEYRLKKSAFKEEFFQIKVGLAHLENDNCENIEQADKNAEVYNKLTGQLLKLIQNAATVYPCEDMLTLMLLLLAEYTGSGEDIYNHKKTIAMLRRQSLITSEQMRLFVENINRRQG